ncbi:MAG: endonuclease III, partial [Oscillospiraceae bacterium]
MTKKERAKKIVDALENEYPLAECTLDYENAWQLVVSVRLAAQCTDARV